MTKIKREYVKGMVDTLMDTVMDVVEKNDTKSASETQKTTQKTYFCAFCEEDQEFLGYYEVGKRKLYLCDECLFEMNKQYYNQK